MHGPTKDCSRCGGKKLSCYLKNLLSHYTNKFFNPNIFCSKLWKLMPLCGLDGQFIFGKHIKAIQWGKKKFSAKKKVLNNCIHLWGKKSLKLNFTQKLIHDGS